LFFSHPRNHSPTLIALQPSFSTIRCDLARVLESDFVVVPGTGTARDFIRLLPVELQ
jgi:hypothetical protein